MPLSSAREKAPRKAPQPVPALEALLLYCILFLPGALRRSPLSEPAPEPAVFSASGEFIRIIAYNLPALALIWYLWRRDRRVPLPSFKDLLAFFWALPSLILTGVCVSLAAARFPGYSQGFMVQAPRGITGMTVMFFSCLSTGYLEESYFRYYLGEKLGEMGLPPWVFILISSVLFALCHLYEGPWGAMNALLAALILALIYTRFRCLHGLAFAHGLYNAVSYLTSLGAQAP
jgi:membrane protease YdiL (CAAX protease family)